MRCDVRPRTKAPCLIQSSDITCSARSTFMNSFPPRRFFFPWDVMKSSVSSYWFPSLNSRRFKPMIAAEQWLVKVDRNAANNSEFIPLTPSLGSLTLASDGTKSPSPSLAEHMSSVWFTSSSKSWLFDALGPAAPPFRPVGPAFGPGALALCPALAPALTLDLVLALAPPFRPVGPVEPVGPAFGPVALALAPAFWPALAPAVGSAHYRAKELTIVLATKARVAESISSPATKSKGHTLSGMTPVKMEPPSTAVQGRFVSGWKEPRNKSSLHYYDDPEIMTTRN